MASKSTTLRFVALAAALLVSLAGAAYIRYELVFLVPYILAVLIVYRWGRPQDIYIVASFSTALIVVGHLLDGPAQSTTVNVGEHLVQIATLWLVALLLGQRLTLEQRLARQQIDLEAQVRARTAALEAEVVERKRMEQQLRALNEELEDRVARRTAALAAALADLQRAARLKDEFLGVMSHELRTPLTGIMASAELLETEVVGPLNARQLRHVQSVMQSGERLLTMVDSILSYTNVVAGNVDLHPERCGLALLLAAAAARCERSREKRQQSLTIVVDPPDLAVTTDCGGLATILDRLLDNAVKFTPDGGALGLEARRAPAPGSAPGRDAGQTSVAGGVQIVVWDTGIGIGPEELAKVTAPFIQADSRLARAYEGAGLGLAYVTQMLDLLGGRLDVENNPGGGSRFIVTLP